MTPHPSNFADELAKRDETILRITAIVERLEAVVEKQAANIARLEAENAALKIENATLVAKVEAQAVRIAELEEKLGIPPKTPDNSSTPPSKSNKPSSDDKPKDRRASHPGAHRPLHPNPTVRREFRAERCSCGADLSGVDQPVKERYDHVEIPKIEPIVTRVELCGGTCPCCGETFKADAPDDMPRGSPFGPNLCALVVFLRLSQNISLERLIVVLLVLFGVDVSEGGLVNILKAASESFKTQADGLADQVRAGDVIASDETTVRVFKKNWWLWVFLHATTAYFTVAPTRAKTVVAGFLGEERPEYWLSDRYGGQLGWATIENQICLAHFIRDSQYAVDCGDDVFAPNLILLLQRACRIGRRRERLTDATLKTYKFRLEASLDKLMKLAPPHKAGKKLQKVVRKVRRHLFVFVTVRTLSATNNGCERALRPCTVFRKVTNCFRSEWGAKLYANYRSVVETARRRSIGVIDAIRLTLDGKPLQADV
jgi:transposase